MVGIGSILLELFVMFVAAKVAGEVFDRLGQPPVVGELLAGALIGPHALNLVGQPSAELIGAFSSPSDAAVALETVHQLFAALGAVVLLFFVGLETPLVELMRIGTRAAAIASGGVIASYGVGVGLAIVAGMPLVPALFIGAILGSTSVGISARVFADLGKINSREARIVLSAAVFDDILGLLGLTVVSTVGRTGTANVTQLEVLGAQAIAFVVLAALACTFAVRRFRVHLESLHLRDAPFVLAMALCLGLAALATRIGLAALVGAFLAGIAFAETHEQFELERRASPVYELLVPFFFVVTGSQVDWRVFLVPTNVAFVVGLVLVAVLTKVIGCGVAAWGLGRWATTTIGVGMIPRGEVSLLAATTGASIGVLTNEVFSVVVAMSVFTTLAVAPVLLLLYRVYGEATPLPDWQEARSVLPEF